jgi:cytochrome c oxidase subunit II
MSTGADYCLAFALWPPGASEGARRVDTVFLGLTLVSGFFVLLISGLLVRFAVKYRAGSPADRANPIQRTGRWELTWIGVPVLLMVGIFVWAGAVFIGNVAPPAAARPIYVVGKQWMWKIQHPEGPEEINELHVPAGEPIKLVLRSQDVIHSFFVPAFRLKQDALPGRYTTLWFRATTPGTYPLYCAEYCGAEHSAMRGRVVVMPPGEFAAWLGAALPASPVPGTPGTPQAPLAVGGQLAFQRFGCVACHTPTSAVLAPRLDGIFGRPVRLANGQTVTADEEYIRESILRPNAKISAGYAAPSLMPTYEGQLDTRALNELVEFIRRLRDGWPEELRPHDRP